MKKNKLSHIVNVKNKDVSKGVLRLTLILVIALFSTSFSVPTLTAVRRI